MKGLAGIVLVIHLSFIHANTNGPIQVEEFTAIKQLNPVRLQQLIPDANSLVEVDLLKDYYADAQNHIIRKRQAGPQPDADPAPSQKRRRRRRRRRRKKVSSGSPPQQEQIRTAEPPVEPPVDMEAPSPVENVLDPSLMRRERARRPRPPPTPVDVPEAMPAAPTLSEMRKEDTNGLLRAEELQANYIKTDMMRANRLKADRIKADKIKAQDVVVTSKSRRPERPKPRLREFVQLEPTYERIGTQRLNSIVDSHRLEPLQISQADQPNYFDTHPYVQQPNLFEAQQLMQSRYNNRGLFMRPLERSRKRQNRGRKISQPPPFQPGEVLPDIPYATRQLIPKLSEFIAEPPSFRSTSQQVKQKSMRAQHRPSFDHYDPFTDRMSFDNPDVHFRAESVNKKLRDTTSKSYLSQADSWFFS